MNELQTVCLLNDSFPPLIDGVANTVVNYAAHIPDSGRNAMVVTPSHPQADDSKFSYPVLRYPSVNFKKLTGYTAGIPFSPEAARRVSESNTVLLHSHCPIMSTFMARQLRQITNAPIVLTYHTKFDIDIAAITQNERVQNACKKILVENISACDEVWVVSRGAGENLRSLGYQGDYIVMPNGVDIPRGKVPPEKIQAVCGGYDLPKDVPLYIFVGRMRWYKGIRLILDALAKMDAMGKDFRMVFIGDGDDREEIERCAKSYGIDRKCVFTGAVHDREALRAWYSRADLFLFPSTFDTNGLVVREAAACELPAVLITGSCAAEGITDGKNGFLIDENADSLCARLLSLYGKNPRLIRVGQNASRELYISWKDSVAEAAQRYEVVIDRYRSGEISHRKKPVEGIMKMNGELMEALGALAAHRRN